MAQDRPGGEPTEQPTAKRLADARRRGQVARSRDLTGAAAFAGALLGFAASASSSAHALKLYLSLALERAAREPERAQQALGLLQDGALVGARVVLPIAVAAALAAFAVGYLQVGGLLSLAPLRPSFARLSPAAGFRKLFSGPALSELGKSLVKLCGVLLIAYALFSDRATELLRLASLAPDASLGLVTQVATTLCLRVAILFAIVGGVDLLLSRRALIRELRMTRHEVTREMKESEGDPHHKAERQRLHREAAEHDMIEQVAKADCVIVNPEHLAVALRYDAATMTAPRVVAKGEGLMAQRIRELARQHRVPIYRDVPLARTLTRLDLGAEIPEPLFDAIAEVLRFVYALQNENQSPSHSHVTRNGNDAPGPLGRGGR